MANYAQIAQKTWTANREDGTQRTIQLTFEEKDGVAADLAIPLVQDIVTKKGNRSDEVNKPVKVDELTLQLKDEQTAGDLISRIDGCGYRQLRVTVTDVGNDYELFKGYVRGDQTEFGLYKKVQSIKVKAAGGLADLQNTSVDRVGRTVAQIGADIGSSLDISRPVDVFTSIRHEGKAVADPLPKELSIDPKMAAGNTKDANLLKAISGMNTALGWQVFQENGRLVFAEPWERFNNPVDVNKYEDNGAGGFTNKTENHLVTLNKDNVIRGGTFSQLPRVASYTHRFGLLTRDAFVFHGAEDVPGSGSTTNSQGMLRSGDVVNVGHEGVLNITITSGDFVQGTLRWGQVKLHDLVSGNTLYYNFGTKSWTDSVYWRTRDFSHQIHQSDYDASFEFGDSGSVKLEPVPEGVIGSLEIVMDDTVTLSTGNATNSVTHTDVDAFADEVEAEENVISHAWQVTSGEPGGQQLEGSFFLADEDLYTSVQDFDVDGIVHPDSWLREGGTTGRLGAVVCDTIGSLLIGIREQFKVRIRDLQRASLLSVFQIDAVKALPVEIKHSVLKGYYDIRLKGNFDAVDDSSSFYSPDAPSEAGTGDGSGSSSGGPDGSGTSDHGRLKGLDDPTDHPWALQTDFSNVTDYSRLDLRYIRPNTTPSLDQVILNNPPSADNHALRAGQVLNTDSPLAGGGKLRNGLRLKLNYNTDNLKSGASGLNTIQDIHTNADVVFRSLALALGLTLDDENGYLQTETFVGDFGGNGVQLKKQNGKWRLTVDDLTVRNQMKVFELLVQQLQGGASFLFTEGAKADEVQHAGDAGWTFNDTTVNPFQDGATTAEGRSFTYIDHYKCFIPQDTLLQLDVDDLIKRQQFNGRDIGVTNATIIDKEGGSTSPTDNSPRRYFTIYIEDDGSQAPKEGYEFARLGNLSDPSRQGGMIIASSDDGAPYMRTFYGVKRHSDFGKMHTIKGQQGRLDNLVIPEFPDLDGSQQNLFGAFWKDNIYVKDGHFRGTVTITDPDNSNAATKDYVDSSTGSSANMTLRSDSEPTARPGPTPLQEGDIWLDTDNGDAPSSWNGSQWVRMYTKISGGDIATGTVSADRLDIDAIFSKSVNINGKLTMEANGRITNLNEDYKIDHTGFSVQISDTYNQENAYKLKEGNNTRGRIWLQKSLSPGLGEVTQLMIAADGIHGIRLAAGSGHIFMNLPSTEPERTGALWNDNGTVKVSAFP